MSTPGNNESARHDSILTGVLSKDSITEKSTNIARGTGCTDATPSIELTLFRPFCVPCIISPDGEMNSLTSTPGWSEIALLTSEMR